MKVDAVLYLVLTKSERQVGDLNARKCFSCSDHEMVAFEVLMEGTRQKAAGEHCPDLQENTLSFSEILEESYER